MWRPPNPIKHPLPPTRWPSADEAAAARLFTPVRVGPMVLAQRTWVPAMVPWRATEAGEVTEAMIEWYGRFAEGRPGVLVVEATGVRDVPSGPLLRIGDDRYVAGLRRLADVVRARSGGETRVLIQLIDFLRVRRRPLPEKFFYRFFAVRDVHRENLAEALDEPAWLQAPEAAVRARLATAELALVARILETQELRDLNYGYRETVNDTHLAHIAELPQRLPGDFGAAARRAREAGFDGVELHYAHAYTMAGFLSRANVRTDGYGGDREGRLRLPLEVLAAVRAEVGAGFAVGCRYLGDEVIDDGSRLEDAIWYGERMARAGMDFLSISTGGKFEDAKQPRVGRAVYPYTGRSGYECMPTVHSDARGPFGRNVHLAAAVRRALRGAGLATPVVTAGGIRSFEQAEAILQAGQADIIGSARQSLADPDWFAKVLRGEGAAVRRCTFTNYCEALDQQHKEVTCQLWDRDFESPPTARRSADGRRRLTAPSFRTQTGAR